MAPLAALMIGLGWAAATQMMGLLGVLTFLAAPKTGPVLLAIGIVLAVGAALIRLPIREARPIRGVVAA